MQTCAEDNLEIHKEEKKQNEHQEWKNNNSKFCKNEQKNSQQ